MDAKKRKTLALLGAIALGYTGIRYLPSLLPETLELAEMHRPKGFRKFVAGETSAGSFDIFVGLESDGDANRLELEKLADARVASGICNALYSGLDLKPGQVPMASFSDYYCPYCRVQTKRLGELAKKKGDDIAVAWHELPLLGENSTTAAKAALAAKRQGAYVAFHDRLMRAPFAATPGYLSQLAESIKVDEATLLADMKSKDVATELEDSAALSRVFAFIGTPALVIGRTVIQGQVSDKMIEQIIELEREEGWANACGYT